MHPDSLLQDLRYTFRTLRRDAGFSAFAILIVGLGIGASSTLFSVVNALLLRPLPFRDPHHLVWIANHDAAGLSGQTTQVGHMLDLREQTQSFSDIGGYMAFYGVGDNVLTGQGEPERLSAAPVSANFFQVLGIEPQLGRFFNAEECKWHGPKAALLTHGLWERRFAADPSIVGRALILDGDPVAVVGVLPASFDFGSVFAPGTHIDLIVPFPLSPETNRWGNTMAMIGRLKPGVSLASAQAEVAILAGRITSAHPERNTFEGKLSLLEEHVSGRIRPALVVLACAVGAVMLIVCANLSNLLLARTAARQKEMALRTALGAGQWRLLRQMLTEGVALSTSGAALGAILAAGGTRAVAHLNAVSIPLLQNVRTDGSTLAFTLLIAGATGIIFGLAPALQIAGSSLNDVLKDNTRGSTGGRSRGLVRGSLVVSEIAFACVLLVGAGLLIRSLARVIDVDLGFRPERAATLRVDPDRHYSTQAQQNAYFDEVLRRAKEIPGVQAAGLTDALPLGRNRSWGAPEKGQTYPKGKFPVAFVRLVTDGYIGAMGIPLRAGRDLAPTDTPTSKPVIVINETMARRLWPGRDAVGQVVNVNGESRVVGVVGDVRHGTLEEASGAEMYLNFRQTDDWNAVELVVRASRSAASLAPDVRAVMKAFDPNLPATEFTTLEQIVDHAVAPRRLITHLLGAFSSLALVLAAIGLYGVIAYSVSQRTREIGIRVAVGAQRGDVLRLIVGEGFKTAVVGVVLGLVAARFATRVLDSLLFGVSATDPFIFVTNAAILVSVALVASAIPARRAARVDPMVALRTE